MKLTLLTCCAAALLIISCNKQGKDPGDTSQQPLNITWQNLLGGSDRDIVNAIVGPADGSLLAAGITSSNNSGDVQAGHGANDGWVVKLNGNGIKQWAKNYGGSQDDGINAVVTLPDGSFVFAGYSFSKNGDVTGNNGSADIWVFKTDGMGNLLWSSSIGDASGEIANSIISLSDGGFAVAGSATTGNTDGMVARLDSRGNNLWTVKFGGSGLDVATSIISSGDGGFIVAGYSTSDGVLVGTNHGGFDCWVAKLSAAGVVVWSKLLGGAGNELVYHLIMANDGGYILAGTSTSNANGDVGPNHSADGNNDVWVVKIDASGNKVWDKSLGGAGNEAAFSVVARNGGYGVVAYTTSNNSGDVGTSHGGLDCWLAEIDNTGSLLRQRAMGGSGSDFNNFSLGGGGFIGITNASDGGYVIATDTNSMDGDLQGKSFHGGDSDIWVVKLK